MTPDETREAAVKVSETLQGTPMSLSQALAQHDLDEGLDLNADFCQCLDQHVFCCTTCGWWCEISEMSETEDDVCDECANEDEEDDE